MFDPQAIIAEATQVAPEQTATTVASDNETPQEAQVIEEKVTESTEEKPEDATKPDSELTPEQLAKRELNRKSHQNSKEARLRRENRELKAQYEALTKSQAQPSQANQNTNGQPEKPKEENFNSFMEFLEAKDSYQEKLYEWKLEQKLAELNPKQPAVDQRLVQRDIEIKQDTAEFERRVPEYKNLVAQNLDFFQNMPPKLSDSLQSALLKIPSPALALHTLMKEGSLTDLEYMNPVEIGMTIASAHERGKASMGSEKKATSASAPIESLKGTGRATKELDSMSVEELMKKFNR